MLQQGRQALTRPKHALELAGQAQELARQIVALDPTRQAVRAVPNADIRPGVLEVWISR